MKKVAVLGGGVGGLTAAHELAERGYDVTVYEGRRAFGGKARSMPGPKSSSGKPPLPAEHGFRFFPGFYRHLPDTMARIPSANKTVVDHLTATKRMMLAQEGHANKLIAPTQNPSSLADLEVAVKFMWDFGVGLGIPTSELAYFFERLLLLLCSCDERRYEEWDEVSWWEYIGAAQKSAAFQKFLAAGLTRTLVAAQAQLISARTGGLILCQLLFDMVRVGGRVDRVLDGPTSEVWIYPWIAYLRKHNVKLRGNHRVVGIQCVGKQITGVTVQSGRKVEEIHADYYVAALPVERLREMVSGAMRAAEPGLIGLSQLVVRWMNGAMFYLRKDVRIVEGHVLFIDSPWALTAISQAQFWPSIDLSKLGNGRADGVLSVDISDWNEPGRLTGKAAMDCTKEEIREEVWAQIIAAIDDGSLDYKNVDDWFLDPDIQFLNPTRTTNLEPLLINTAGSWANRPEAVIGISNLFLAADFVRTYTDLATMEGANEAARRAVNGILDAEGSREQRCQIWKLGEPEMLAPLRALDRLRWGLGRPAASLLRVDKSGTLVGADPVVHGFLRAARFAADHF